MKRLITISLLLFFHAAMAEVFTLAPFSGGGKGDPSEFLGPLDLWTEPVVINGVSGGLKISVLDIELRVCVDQLKRNFPDAKFLRNGNSALFEIKENNGRRKRIYLVELGGVYPVIQFSIDLPPKIPDSPSWPRNLPLPPDSKPVSTMEFPSRKATYGYFSTALSADEALRSIRVQIGAQGWQAFGSHDNQMNPAKGDVFINKKPLRIMIVSFSENENGEVKGAIYQKPVRE
jgi:hypothetical protein